MSQPSLARTVVMLPAPARVLFVGTFINRFGNFLGPFLVLYLTAKGYTPGQAGLALGVVGLGNTVGNALGGTVADRLGRRATIVLSMAGSGVCTLAVPLVGPLAGVITLVGLVGVFAQLYRPAAGALLLDVIPDDQRVTAFAVYRLAINLGLGFALTGLAQTVAALGATGLVWTVAEMIYSPAVSAYTGRFAPPHLRGRYQGAYGMAQMAAGAVGPAVGGYLYMRNPTILWAMCGGVGVLAALLVLGVKPHEESVPGA